MEERNIAVTLNKAREWFNSGNATLKKIALQAFNKDELVYNFKNITTFKEACEALGLDYDILSINAKGIAKISKASAAMLKLNIIRKALNFGQDLHLTENLKNSHIYYPYNPFMPKSSTYYAQELKLGKVKVIGNIKNEGEVYCVLGGFSSYSSYGGLGNFLPGSKIGTANGSSAFLGCASDEIARHFGRYFGMLITEAKYGDLPNFEIMRK